MGSQYLRTTKADADDCGNGGRPDQHNRIGQRRQVEADGGETHPAEEADDLGRPRLERRTAEAPRAEHGFRHEQGSEDADHGVADRPGQPGHCPNGGLGQERLAFSGAAHPVGDGLQHGRRRANSGREDFACLHAQLVRIVVGQQGADQGADAHFRGHVDDEFRVRLILGLALPGDAGDAADIAGIVVANAARRTASRLALGHFGCGPRDAPP